MGVSACICSLGTEQSICVPRHVCVGGCVGVKVVRVQLSTAQHLHMDRAQKNKTKKKTGGWSISQTQVLANAAHAHERTHTLGLKIPKLSKGHFFFSSKNIQMDLHWLGQFFWDNKSTFF